MSRAENSEGISSRQTSQGHFKQELALNSSPPGRAREVSAWSFRGSRPEGGSNLIEPNITPSTPPSLKYERKQGLFEGL